jgi:Na+-translocating ferredoxin:NAD+ oxidoreductase RnfC subunit
MALNKHKYGKCSLCGRDADLTFHHLFPRKIHRRKRFQKAHSKEELNQGIHICRPCHCGIHKYYDEMTLATRLNTLEKLLRDENLQRHFRWVARQRIKARH